MRNHGKKDEGRPANNNSKRPHTVFRRSLRNSVPTTNRERRLVATPDLHGYVRLTQSYTYTKYSVPWLTYKFFIITASTIGFSIGLGQIIDKFIR